MGLHGFVHCRCWQDGHAAPAPVEPVGFDDEGWLSLLLPWQDHKAEHAEFDQWRERACPHAAMLLANESVANWAGVRLFQQALRAAGAERFPTLLARVPDLDGGKVQAAHAALMLAELEGFDPRAAVEEQVVLLDEETGRILMRHVASYAGVAIWGPGYRAGVDRDGFFIVTATHPPVTRFRAKRFEQHVQPNGEVLFTDDLRQLQLAMPPIGRKEGVTARRLAVHRQLVRADFSYIVQPLRTLCMASVSTGNPVIWT
ncbi:MAG: hypothetical protein HOV79_19355 [Hamadaea sp.]|nr:hypothetical protein [Hamadaea sp.]